MGRQGWYGGANRGGPRGWGRLLLPLIVGIGLGALLFGGARFGARGASDYRYQSRQSELPQQQAAGEERLAGGERSAASGRPADQYAFERDHGYGPRGGWRHGGFGFGGFLLPLLLIGGGLWLLNRRRGPGAPGGPPAQGGGPGQPVGPAPETPFGPGDAPASGPTYRL